MKEEVSLLKQIQKVVLYAMVFLFPLFFLPFTQEYFLTGKMYFLLFGALVLLLLSTLEFFLTKKLVWEKRPYDNVVVLFFITAVLSVVFSSPNKVQALLNPGYGIASLFSYLILYFYLSREKATMVKQWLIYIPAAVVSVMAVIFLLNPFKTFTFPPILQFLKNPFFTPVGSTLDTAIFLGFAAIMTASHIFYSHKHEGERSPLLLGSLVLLLVGLGASIYSNVLSKEFTMLPPFNLSWYAAVETLKQPVSALFGVGVDNFSAMFTRVKDIAYNTTPLWQVSSFNVSRSAILQILTEAGLFGAVALGLLILQLLKRNLGSKKNLLILGYILLVALLFPISPTVLFILFVLLSGVGIEDKAPADAPFVLHMDKILPLYAVMLVLALGFIGVAGYFGGRAYAAEVYFKKALDGFSTNNANNVYENMRAAIITNPYIERYRINFSQTNLLIANNIASRASQQTAKAEPVNGQANGQQQVKLSDQDRQTIAQAIQASIDEAKAAVSLNPQKASNWENLAIIYRNVINVAQGADSWTVSAYQRAMVLDPQNPVYRVDLGGVLFGLRNFDQASSLFEQAVGLKPDWANAYYNLAWASYQRQDYQRAAQAMQSTISLLDPKRDAADYKRASADLQEIMKKLPTSSGDATKSAVEQPNKIAIPTPEKQVLDPKIKLPKEASPGAK